MNVTNQTDHNQASLWNGAGGRGWVQAQELLDRLFKPFEDLLVQSVSSDDSVRWVLDVGCGTGSTTLAVARLLAGKGGCTGIDISDPMIGAARERAKRESTDAKFIRADAQVHEFEPASFDMIISRFGVMFFDDSVRAFANLSRAVRPGGALRFIAWRSAEENPFMTTAERAAAPLLPNIPARQPDKPGQFAFADPRRILAILDESGWTKMDILPIDISCTLPEKELRGYVSRVGPVARMLEEADDATRAQVIDAVRPAFDPYVQGSEVRFTAACWMVSAIAST